MNRVVDLFAGCGGLSLGFQNAGFEIVGAFESWKLAADCYRQNFTHPVYQTDLSDVETAIKEIEALSPDIIIGGPPCQDFSHAGKRVENNRAALTESFAQIVISISPQWFVMENVERVQTSAAYDAARRIFKKAGYGLTEVVIDASYCGTPQKRKRFFCIGSKGQEDCFLSESIKSNLSTKETTIRDYFGSALDFEYYYRHPRNYNRRAIFSVDEPAPTIRGVNRPVPQGYTGHPKDACELNASIRAMTTLERARIQTFPADFEWIGNKTDMEQMIGNAVPVSLAEFVAKELQHHIKQCSIVSKATIADYDRFFQWLKATQKMTERAQRDIVSRLKRANAFCELPTNPDAYYRFCLEQSDGFKMLASTVRSQLRRAIALYVDFCHSDYSSMPVLQNAISSAKQSYQ